MPTCEVRELTPPRSQTLKLKAEDIIRPGQWYSVERIVALLGVRADLIRAAVRSGSYFHEYRACAGARQYRALHVLGWLRAEAIEIHPTDLAIRLYERQHGTDDVEETPAATESKPSDPIAKAASLADAWAREEESVKLDAARGALAVYMKALCNPEQVNPRDLAEAMVELVITRDRLDRDREIVRRARQLIELHDSSESAAAEMNQRRAEHVRIEAECERKLRDAELAVRQAHNRFRMTRDAESKLAALRRERPILFDDAEPPRLRVS